MSWTGVKQAARGLARAHTVLDLLGKGMSVGAISQELGLSRKGVTDAMHRALKTESIYPGSLTPEEVGRLRQLQAEILSNSRQKALSVQATVESRIGTDLEKSQDATASARLLEAVVRAVEMESNLFGTRQPTKLVSEMLQISYQKSEHKVVVSFDKAQIRPSWADVGLRVVPPDDLEPRQLEANTNGS